MKASLATLLYLLCISGVSQLKVYNLGQAIVGLINAKIDEVLPSETDPPVVTLTYFPSAHFTLQLLFHAGGQTDWTEMGSMKDGVEMGHGNSLQWDYLASHLSLTH